MREAAVGYGYSSASGDWFENFLGVKPSDTALAASFALCALSRPPRPSSARGWIAQSPAPLLGGGRSGGDCDLHGAWPCWGSGRAGPPFLGVNARRTAALWLCAAPPARLRSYWFPEDAGGKQKTQTSLEGICKDFDIVRKTRDTAMRAQCCCHLRLLWKGDTGSSSQQQGCSQERRDHGSRTRRSRSQILENERGKCPVTRVRAGLTQKE